MTSIALWQGDPIDDQGWWQVGFYTTELGDPRKTFAWTQFQFKTPGAALDWVVKWAEDRGFELAIDGTFFNVLTSLKTIPKRKRD